MNRNSNAGRASVSSYTGSDFWLIVAHEIGHNFNGGHSFEQGQGKTGGIMDYGSNTAIGGIQQFNRVYRQDQMCSHMKTELTKDDNKPWCYTDGKDDFKVGGGGGGGTDPTPTGAPTPTCKESTTEDFDNCKTWAAVEYCANPLTKDWMERNCGKPCYDKCMAIKGRRQLLERREMACQRPVSCKVQDVDVDATFQLGPDEHLAMEATITHTGDQVLARGTLGAYPFTWHVKEGMLRFSLATYHLGDVVVPGEVSMSTVMGTLLQFIEFKEMPGLQFQDTTDDLVLTGVKVLFEELQDSAVTVKAARLGAAPL